MKRWVLTEKTIGIKKLDAEIVINIYLEEQMSVLHLNDIFVIYSEIMVIIFVELLHTNTFKLNLIKSFSSKCSRNVRSRIFSDWNVFNEHTLWENKIHF